MAQIVHDVAPGGKLAFATAFTPAKLGFAENIKALAKSSGAGADVIADDVFYFEEPFFQEGPVAVAVSEVTEDDGVTYFSAAGNDNLFDSAGNEIASWEAPKFRDSGACPPAVVALSEEVEAEEGFGLEPSHCLDFDPGAGIDRTFGITVATGATLSIDPSGRNLGGVGTDIDAFLLDSSGELSGGSRKTTSAASAAVRVRRVEKRNRLGRDGPAGDQQLLRRPAAPEARPAAERRRRHRDRVPAFDRGRRGRADGLRPQRLGGRDHGRRGALRRQLDGEPYSSRGPVTHYFGPVDGTRRRRRCPTRSARQARLAATDCGVTTFFAFRAGGLAVLRNLGGRPPRGGRGGPDARARSGDAAEIRTGLHGRRHSDPRPRPLCQGAGLVEAVGAIEALLGSASAEDPACSAPAPAGSVEEARAPGDWGSETPSWTVIEQSGSTPEAIPVAPATRTPNQFTITPTRRPPRPPRRAPSSGASRQGRPHRRRSAQAVFLFGSDQGGVTFLCKVDRGRFHRCKAWFVRRYRLGRHVLRVKARGADGQIDPTPAVYRFRVKRLHRRGASPSGRRRAGRAGRRRCRGRAGR